MVKREPAWTDDDRTQMLALARYEAHVCSGCGFHKSLANDPANHFMPEDEFCLLCQQLAPWQRVRDADDDAAEKALGENPSPSAKRPTDGRTTFLRMLSPDEVAKRQSAKG